MRDGSSAGPDAAMHLGTEVAGYESLLKLLRDEQDALRSADVDALERIAQSKLTLVYHLQDLGAVRARALADALFAMGYHPETIAVCAMLADKDIAGVIAAMRPRVDRWLVAPLPGPRGAGGERMRDALLAAGVSAAAVRVCADVAHALDIARETAGEADRIVVFGSFLTVGAALTADVQGPARRDQPPRHDRS